MAEALRCACVSYSPFARSPAGVALRVRGRVVGGWYTENCAFNPALPPLQAAIVRAYVELGGWHGVEACVLASVPGAPVQHAAQATAVLQSVAPGVSLCCVALEVSE